MQAPVALLRHRTLAEKGLPPLGLAQVGYPYFSLFTFFFSSFPHRLSILAPPRPFLSV